MTKFFARANNNKGTHHNFREDQKLPNEACNQKCFHELYLQSDHNGI